ncbi:hypothetical protein K2173_022573 [Erythroxylum novogranatense]|uniref:Uncharacterized protein n=1 Tax=Erythroxylum novogranatense TaxID=1862640 RepID=A0AAV8TQX6_9ROSI|nr:hypothetical protein K2173_022573 [Erythroxylum novogranatense]
MQETKKSHEEEKQKQKQKQELGQNQKLQPKTNLVWDCGSSLYDSFELKSFERQLDSAIINSSRSLSMPHFPDRRLVAPAPPTVSKKPSKISRSLQKLLKSVFKSKQNPSVLFRPHDEYYVVYDKTGALTTIPEVPEIDFGAFSPDISSLVKRTSSARFPAASIGISSLA